MSRWELFTWCSVAILAVGPLLVLAFFLRDLPELWRRHRGTWFPEDDQH
jgi:hypothetical protein